MYGTPKPTQTKKFLKTNIILYNEKIVVKKDENQ